MICVNTERRMKMIMKSGVLKSVAIVLACVVVYAVIGEAIGAAIDGMLVVM